VSSIILLLLLSAVPGDPAAAEQDKRKRIQELMMRADQENKKGNVAESNRCLAEAWALTADVYFEEGKATASNEAWNQAKRYGWSGEAPVEKARRTPTAPAPAPKAVDEPHRTNGVPKQEGPVERPERSQAKRKAKDPWPYLAMGPYRSPRNNGWSGLLNTPPLEEALVLPPGAWLARAMVDISSSNWSSSEEGGESSFNASYLTQSLEVDYGLSEQFLVGLRLTTGELGQGGDNLIRVWEGGRQVVPSGERSFAMESLVARGKFSGSAGFADFGVLAEIKVPLAGDEDFLTTDSIDLGFSGILTKRWKDFTLTLNAGLVFPIGDAGLFTEGDGLDPYFHGGLAAAVRVHDRLALLGQFEFNTGAFGELAVLDGLTVMTVSAGARYKLTPGAFLSGQLGTGLSDESGGLFLSSGIDIVF
jgi:hypothetical protein